MSDDETMDIRFFNAELSSFMAGVNFWDAFWVEFGGSCYAAVDTEQGGKITVYLTADVQKASAQLEVSKAAPQTVLNNQ
jgi:hypothetical protein